MWIHCEEGGLVALYNCISGRIRKVAVRRSESEFELDDDIDLSSPFLCTWFQTSNCYQISALLCPPWLELRTLAETGSSRPPFTTPFRLSLFRFKFCPPASEYEAGLQPRSSVATGEEWIENM